MAEWGSICRLCDARGDYCAVQFLRGLDVDCRILIDMLTDEQIAELKECIVPEWWEKLQAAKERNAP